MGAFKLCLRLQRIESRREVCIVLAMEDRRFFFFTPQLSRRASCLWSSLTPLYAAYGRVTSNELVQRTHLTRTASLPFLPLLLYSCSIILDHLLVVLVFVLLLLLLSPLFLISYSTSIPCITLYLTQCFQCASGVPLQLFPPCYERVRHNYHAMEQVRLCLFISGG